MIVSDLMFKGMLEGLEEIGATLVKHDLQFLYFDISTGSAIDDLKKLRRLKQLIHSTYGIGIKVKRV